MENLAKAKDASCRKQVKSFWKKVACNNLVKVPFLSGFRELHANRVQNGMNLKYDETKDACIQRVAQEAKMQMHHPEDSWKDPTGHWQLMLKDCRQLISELFHFSADVLTDCATHFVNTKIAELKDSIPSMVRDKVREHGVKGSPGVEQSLKDRFQTVADEFDKNANRLLKKFDSNPSEDALWELMKKLNTHWSIANMVLPIYEQSSAIINDFLSADVLVVECDTGSGKSTALPALLQAELGGRVCISQPRILPCTRTANFVSKMLGGICIVSSETADKASKAGAQIVYQTDGLLSARLIGPEAVSRNPFDVICLDEVHERNKNLDLAIMALARMVKRGKAEGQKVPKVVVMSATLDSKTLLPFGNNDLKVKKFTIKVPSPYEVKQNMKYVGKHYMNAVEEIFKKKHPEEQILCFVPGTADVEKACASFLARVGCSAEPLHANRDPADMQEALERGAVFFSTNIAETSITIPRLAHVVDAGKQKVPSWDNHVFQLQECFSARSTLNQRRGRCGRVREGTYYPAYRAQDVTRDFALPELLTGDVVDVEFRLWCHSAEKTKFGSKLQELKEDLPINTKVDEDRHHAISKLSRCFLSIYDNYR